MPSVLISTLAYQKEGGEISEYIDNVIKHLLKYTEVHLIVSHENKRHFEMMSEKLTLKLRDCSKICVRKVK